MTKKELRELDAWILQHVFGYTHDMETCWYCQKGINGDLYERGNPHVAYYHDDPVSAMQVLEKCAVGSLFLHITKLGDRWIIFKGEDEDFANRADAETLPLAICLFAKQLFSKP